MKRRPEAEILDLAIDALLRETGIPAKILADKTNRGCQGHDATLEIVTHELLAEIKNWAQHINLGAMIGQVRQMPGPGILVADYINPNMADKLKAQDIQFIDTAGNAHINLPGVFVFVKGNRPTATTQNATKYKARAFGNTGLKVVFAFLCDPTLVGRPYRQIAETAAVAVGTVGWVLRELKAGGYIRQKGRNASRQLIKRQQLLNRWVENYPERLRPKQKIGDFIAADGNWWKVINLEEFDGYWGGEIAAAKLTRHLKPEIAIVYLEKTDAGKLIKTARLRKATRTYNDDHQVRLYQPFWKKPQDYNAQVHPVLAYADLIATAEPRNLEIAQIVYDKHLNGYLGKD